MPLSGPLVTIPVSNERRELISEQLLPMAFIGKYGNYLKSLLYRRGQKDAKTDSLAALAFKNPFMS